MWSVWPLSIFTVQVVIRQKEAVQTVEVEEGLGPVYNEDGDTFNIMNKVNIQCINTTLLSR